MHKAGYLVSKIYLKLEKFTPAIFSPYIQYTTRMFHAKTWTSLRGARVFANDLFDFAALSIENVWKMA